MVNIRGHEITVNVKDSSNRRALQFKNNIIGTLSKLGLTDDDIDIPLERVVIKKSKASCKWYYDHHHLYFSYNGLKFIENLYIVSKVIEFEVNALLNKEKTSSEFIEVFTEDEKVEQERKDARKYLGVSEDCRDFKMITDKYKEMAKKLHPDTDSGDTEEFKKLNKAHKTLKRELC